MYIDQNEITNWLTEIFTAAGCPEGEAALIATHLVDADASGHPSHGIVRVPRYMEYIKEETLTDTLSFETQMSNATEISFDGIQTKLSINK